MLISSYSLATAYTTGSGDYWLALCQGEDSEHAEKGFDFCEVAILGFWWGTIAEQHQQSGDFRYCVEVTGDQFRAELVSYLLSNLEAREQEFIEFMPHFLDSEYSCEH